MDTEQLGTREATMRTVWLLAAATVMLLLLVLVASSAEAKPPTTTEPTVIPWCDSVMTDTYRGQTTIECLWIPTGSTVATVEVTTSTPISSLTIFVRDSSPGDICVLDEWGKSGDTTFVSSFPLAWYNPDTGLTEHYVDYSEHWCGRFDPIAGQRADLNGDALHVQVSFAAKRGTTVSLELFDD